MGAGDTNFTNLVLSGNASIAGNLAVTGGITLPASGVTAGSYSNASVTVGADGRVTSASSGQAGGATIDLTGDPHYSTVSLLLHCDGTNNSTTFTDNSSNAFTVTANGGAKISTTQKKFGTASAYFDGVNDYLELAANNAFNFSNKPFCVECWFYPTTVDGNNRMLVAKDVYGSSFSFGMYFTSTLLKVATGSGSTYIDAAVDITASSWYHAAVSWDGATTRLFLNGQLVALNTIAFTYVSNAPLVIGCGAANNPNSFFEGYIDEVRISRGDARYTGSFLLPVAAYGNQAVTFPSPATTGQLFFDGTYLNVCTAGGSPGTWARV